MKRPGPGSRTRPAGPVVAGATAALAAVTVLAALAASAASAGGAGGGGFLIPGVALRDADFVEGAWCRYLVVDEVLGIRDSTEVTIAVTARDTSGGADSWWLEVESGPVGAPPSERDVAAALISAGMRRSAPGDSLVQYVTRLYIKRGSRPAEAADPRRLDQLTLANPTSDAAWELIPDQTVVTPQGTLSCVRKHLVATDDRKIDMGRVTLVKSDADTFDVWLCRDVPVFHVAKSVIGRVRSSRTVPAVPGIPNKEREASRTTVELVAFGSGARARIRLR